MTTALLFPSCASENGKHIGELFCILNHLMLILGNVSVLSFQASMEHS